MPLDLTADEISRLRQRPHRTRVWLSIFQPGTVLAARINQPGIAKGTRDITIAVLSGDVNSVERGMTCYIGTTPGGQDLGRIRSIDCTPAVLSLAENATDWVDGWYLTVVAYYEPWAVFSRIILDANKVPTFYKDYDIAYTDQNQYMDPVPVMGPNHAGFLASGAMGVYYSSSGTFDPDDWSRPTGYEWVFEGGIPTASFIADPGYVQYTGAGHFLTSLTVLGNAGRTFTGRRHVSVYTRPDEGPRPPILAWSLQSFEGARDQGGYSVRIAIHEQADFSKVVDGALIVLFTDDWQGGVYGKKAAGAEHRDTILFAGYVEDDSIRLNPADHFLEFNVRSILGIAERLASYSAALDSKKNAMTWTEMRNMTVDKGVIHFMRWQTTLLSIADFSPTGNRLDVQFLDFGRGSVTDSIKSLYQSALLATPVTDRQGKIWAEVDASLVATGTARNAMLGTGFMLSRQDWRGEIAFSRFGAFQPVSYMELGGIGYDGPSTGSIEPYLAGAPGEVAGYYGSVERQQGLVLESQGQLNALVGQAYARSNAQFPEISIPLAGDYRILDIAPQSRILVTLDPADNYRGLAWADKAFVPQVVSYEPRIADQALMMSVRAREETHGPPGVKITIPVEPPYDNWDIPDWNIEFPPIQPFPPWLPPVAPPPATGDLVYALIDGHLARTRQFFSAASPHWEEVPLTGVTGSLFGQSAFFAFDPLEPLNHALLGTNVTGPAGVQGPRIYSTQNLNITGSSPTWTEIWGVAENSAITAVSTQRALLAPPERRAWDKQWHFPFGRASLGAVPAYVHGDPVPITPNLVVPWAFGNINSLGMNYQTSTWENLVVQGSSVYFIGQTRIYWNAMPDLPGAANWVVQRTSTFMQIGAPPAVGAITPSLLIMWCEGLQRRLRFSALGANDGGDEIIFTYGDSEYALITGNFEGKQAIRPVPGIPNAFFYMASRTSGTGPQAIFGVIVPGTDPLIRATFGGGTIGPVEVLPSDANKLCSFGRTVAVGARIIGSDDGGYTWRDKTGDWAASIAPIADGSTYTSIGFASTV